MRVARILTNETCNQNCSFCDARRSVERPSFARGEAVIARIEDAVRGSAREIVLTGGEPTLRRDLAALVARAKRARPADAALKAALIAGPDLAPDAASDAAPNDASNAASDAAPYAAPKVASNAAPDAASSSAPIEVTLETNAALITDAMASALARAGLDKARVHVPAWGEAADSISQDEGGFARTLQGIGALARAGIAIEAAAPVVRATIDRIADLPARLVAEVPAPAKVKALVLGVPARSPDPSALVSIEEAALAIDAVATAARAIGLAVRMDPGSLIPPCAFPKPSRVAHLFSLTRGGAERPGYRHAPECDRCEVRDRCPGAPEEALARDRDRPFEFKPISDDRTRRRLSLVASVEDQIARELVTRDVRRMADGATVRESIVRVNFHCNQACRFCFVSTHLPAAEDAAIEAAIAEIAGAGGVLTLSGGEPTLNPRLPELVRLGKRLGARFIELQTNAIRLADPALAKELADAGVDLAFVSLHGSTAALSDQITEAPGTFEKTLRGIEEARRAGLDVRLNFVFCEANKLEFPAYIAMVARLFPGAVVTVSHVAASTDVVPMDASLIPRFSDVMPALAEGVRLAKELGVELSGFESMCGIPLCLVPDDLSRFFQLADAPPDGGEFVKVDACSSCALRSRCFGVRRGYAALHGTSELRPCAPLDASPSEVSRSQASRSDEPRSDAPPLDASR